MPSTRLFSMVAATALLFTTLAATAAPAPDFKLPTRNGQVSLADLKGKVVYLDFWASWCPPCRRSFPWMNDLQKRYGSQGLAVVAVNVDTKRAQAEHFLEETPASFTVAFDPAGSTAEAYDLKGMPTSFLIDRDGKVYKMHIGFRDKDTARLEQWIRSLL